MRVTVEIPDLDLVIRTVVRSEPLQRPPV